jgi:hypothetical protein
VVSACATVLQVMVVASVWVAIAATPALGAPAEDLGAALTAAPTRVAVAGGVRVPATGDIRVENPRATPVEALFVGAAGLFALGMGTARMFGRGQEW